MKLVALIAVLVCASRWVYLEYTQAGSFWAKVLAGVGIIVATLLATLLTVGLIDYLSSMGLAVGVTLMLIAASLAVGGLSGLMIGIRVGDGR